MMDSLISLALYFSTWALWLCLLSLQRKHHALVRRVEAMERADHWRDYKGCSGARPALPLVELKAPPKDVVVMKHGGAC